MLQNHRKKLGFKKNMVYEIPPGGGGGKPYPASGLILKDYLIPFITSTYTYPDSHRFMQDNDPKHVSRSTIQFMKDNTTGQLPQNHLI